jgi:hypothetical protein
MPRVPERRFSVLRGEPRPRRHAFAMLLNSGIVLGSGASRPRRQPFDISEFRGREEPRCRGSRRGSSFAGPASAVLAGSNHSEHRIVRYGFFQANWKRCSSGPTFSLHKDHKKCPRVREGIFPFLYPLHWTFLTSALVPSLLVIDAVRVAAVLPTNASIVSADRGSSADRPPS